MARPELNSQGRSNNVYEFKRRGVRSGNGENKSENKVQIFVSSVDYAVLLTTILLVLFGIVMVFSSSYYTAGNSSSYNYDIYYFLKKHILWASIGFVAMYFVSNFNYLKLKKLIVPFYCICNVLLIAVLFVGETINGAKRWIQIGPIGFQPSEIAKLSIILLLAYFISERPKILTTWKGFFKCVLIMAVPMGLTGMENMSTALVMAIIGMAVMFVASPRIIYFVLSGIVGIIGALMMIFGEGFRAARYKAWKDPFSDAMGKGYQTIQSLYAIASGGLFGLGLGQSRQKLGYIPEGHNDIIFAIICEELGLFGAAILIILFIVLIWRGIKIAMNSKDMFGTLIATGIIVMIAVQVIINVAVVTNTIPNTGIPLPFISYGGTSLVFMMVSIGILLNISRYIKAE